MTIGVYDQQAMFCLFFNRFLILKPYRLRLINFVLLYLHPLHSPLSLFQQGPPYSSSRIANILLNPINALYFVPFCDQSPQTSEISKMQKWWRQPGELHYIGRIKTDFPEIQFSVEMHR